MQQQIQAERAVPKILKGQPITSQNSNNQTVLPQAQHPEHSTINHLTIDELISEHYDQDFDSISDHSAEQPEEEIKEELINQSQSIEQLRWNKNNKTEQLEQDLEQLREQCRRLEYHILSTQQQINRYKFANQEQQEEQINKNTAIQQLLAFKESNQDILQKQKQEQLYLLTTTFGRDALSIQSIINRQQQVEDPALEQRLLAEITHVNTLIQMAQHQIGKINREVKKNGENLPISQEQRDQAYSKYKKLFRQVEQKKDKVQVNNQKIIELQKKLAQLSNKLGNEIKIQRQQQITKDNTGLIRRYKQLQRLKQAQNKMTKIVLNKKFNLQAAAKRSIFDIKKETRQLTIKIDKLDEKNSLIQNRSEQVFQRYKSCNASPAPSKQRKHLDLTPKIKYQNRSSSNSQYASSKFSPSYQYDIKKLPIMTGPSQLKDVDLSVSPSNRNISTPSSIMKPATPVNPHNPTAQSDQSDSRLYQHANQNVFKKKQFKLKLPPQSIKTSQRHINISMDVVRQNPSPIFSVKQSLNQKLSITQRLQRIALLEKEDRMQSYKLYQRHTNLQKQKNNSKQLNIQIDLTAPVQTPYVLKKKKADSLIQNDIIPQPKYIQEREKERVSLQSKIVSPKAERKTFLALSKHNFLSQNDIPHPQKLFSSIQQKLIMRQSSVRESFKLDNKQASDLAQDSSTVSLGGVRQMSMLRRRVGLRQKKIPDEYMKALQQRGRRILQLDNENEC